MLFAAFAIPLDSMFFAATLDKLHESHYLTLVIALFVVSLLIIWRIGRRYLMERAQRLDMPVALLADMIAERPDIKYEARPAVFFQHLPFPADMEVTPHVLLRQIQQTSALGQPTVIVEFITGPTPRVPDPVRVTMRAYDNQIYAVQANFGFAEHISIEPVVDFGKQQGWWGSAEEIRYFLGREDLRPLAGNRVPRALKWLFIWLHRQDQSLIRALEIPSSQFTEVSIKIPI
jgi:KUP system potassium uptake protein